MNSAGVDTIDADRLKDDPAYQSAVEAMYGQLMTSLTTSAADTPPPQGIFSLSGAQQYLSYLGYDVDMETLMAATGAAGPNQVRPGTYTLPGAFTQIDPLSYMRANQTGLPLDQIPPEYHYQAFDYGLGSGPMAFPGLSSESTMYGQDALERSLQAAQEIQTTMESVNTETIPGMGKAFEDGPLNKFGALKTGLEELDGTTVKVTLDLDFEGEKLIKDLVRREVIALSTATGAPAPNNGPLTRPID